MKFTKCFWVMVILAAIICSAVAAQGQAEIKPLPFVEGSWTLAILPDTQVYSERYPEIFAAQTQWIVDNKEKRNIAFVLQEGDITNNGSEKQWANAANAMSRLDGVVPYIIAPGNHDYQGAKDSKRFTLMDKFFPVSKLQQQPTFGGTFERGKPENSYSLFSAGDRDWVVIALEFGPRDDVLRWADIVLKKYPDRSAIIVTHAYLYNDDRIYDITKYPDQKWNPHGYNKTKFAGGCNDGQEIWQKLVSPNKNVAFVFCGHVLGDGAGRLVSRGEMGQTVNQVMANYQMRKDGGEGYLRLMEFLPDGKTVQVRSYSPCLHEYLTDPEQQFTLELPVKP